MYKDPFLLFFLILIVYVVILIILRFIGFGKKKSTPACSNCCPLCYEALYRIKRTNLDKITNYLTLKLFDCKRYICNNCDWQGLRWEENYKSKH